MHRFALIGAAGYVAPRHMKAIKEVGGDLVAALDPHDSVGILDSFFPDCKYFREFERFDRFCSNAELDFVVVCSPNYLHEAHCRFGLRVDANVICEKPLTLRSKNLERLIADENLMEHDIRVMPVLQLRHHPEVEPIRLACSDGFHEVKVEYHTPRGDWYPYSWKGDVEKSGGLATNIGVHLFDLACYLFGDCKCVHVSAKDDRHVAGSLHLERAKVTFDLSNHKDDAPVRTFKIDEHELDLSGGFNDLHIKVYQDAVRGSGFTLEDTMPAIRICERIRNSNILGGTHAGI